MILFLTGFAWAQESKEKSVENAPALEAPSIQDKKNMNWPQLLDFCANSYKTSGQCPEHKCNLGCMSGVEYEKCTISCEPKSCVELSADNCPLDVCMSLTGCDGNPVCYPQPSYSAPVCGDLAYAWQDVECCKGYVKRCGVEFFDGSCDMNGQNTLDSVPICLPCGNGICNQFENQCNCPEDCSAN